MASSTPVVAVVAGLTLGWGAVAAALGSALDWNPVVAPATLVVPVAAFGLLCRGRDVVEALAASFLVAYAGYLGMAAVRAAQADLIVTAWTRAPMSSLWPAIVLAGIPFALVFTVAVALPLSRLPARSAATRSADAFWDAIAECGARAERRSGARR